VRGKRAIEPRWDRFLPVGFASAAPEAFRECLDAIPLERRTAAIMPQLGPKPPRFDRIETFASVIEFHPDPALVDAVFAMYKMMAERPNPSAHAALEDVAKRLPKLAPTISKQLARKKVAPLVFEPVPLPARDKLSALQRKQLAWFEKEGGDWSVLELFIVRDEKRKHVYDAAIHAGDDGFVFRVGTATKVATFAQGGAEGRGEALMAALEQGLAEWNAARKAKAKR
jgi:hypothetical protein